MFEPVCLEGRGVRLEPLALSHAEGLLAASVDPEIWTYLMVPQPQTVSEMEAWIGAALDQQRLGNHLPFAIVDRARNAVCGTTRYLDIRPADRAVEIGWTWLSREAQRTAVNTECKFLLLRHAFEKLGCERVQLKTDARNARSRTAIERIGGQFEGILRRYQRYWHGFQRDTAIYGIVAEAWPKVKEQLEAKLDKPVG